MIKKLFNNFFTPKPFGLNISDNSLRFAKIISLKEGLILEKYGEFPIPFGFVEIGRIKNLKKMEEVLIKLKKLEKVKVAYVSLPIGAMGENILESYISVFNQAGIKILSFEFEPESMARNLISKDDFDTNMIVDFGRKNTGIYIISNGVVMSASNLNFGGEDLSKILQKKMNIDFGQAEELKKKHGLQQNMKNEEIFSSLLDGVTILHKEIDKHFLSWYKDKKESDKNPIQKIILCGGGANLNRLDEYFSTRLKNKVQIGNVWVNITNNERDIKELDFKESLSFSSALGLALIDFY